jgi:hypothetical protein
MSDLPSRLETVTKKQFITIPQAVAVLFYRPAGFREWETHIGKAC